MGVDLRVPIKGTPTGNLCRGACLVVFLCGGNPRIKTPLNGYPRVIAVIVYYDLTVDGEVG
jgi:hypothetical protein